MQAPKSRMPSRRARSRNAAVVDSSVNTMSWNPWYGSVSVGNFPFATPASQSNAPESTSTPPMTTPWPERNLVAEWKTRSAPCSNGRISQGVVNVESTSSGTPWSCASDATRGTSSTSSPGLPSVSPNSSRVSGRIGSAPGVEVTRIHERRRDAEPGQRVVEQVVRSAVERARGDDVTPRAHERGDCQVQRRLAACGRDRTDATFECGDPFLENGTGGIGDARVNVSRALHVEQRGGMVAVREHERRRLIDRRRARAGRGIRLGAGVQRQRVETMRFRLGHRRVCERRSW